MNQSENSMAGYHQFSGHEEDQTHGSFEVFYDDAAVNEHDGEPRNFGPDGDPVKPGWYWWACFPGCIPDGDPAGPFATSTEAFDDAQDF